MYRYFLHPLSEWPVAGACNAEPFGPGDDNLYLATFDAEDPHCDVYEQRFAELTREEARTWVRNLTDDEELPA